MAGIGQLSWRTVGAEVVALGATGVSIPLRWLLPTQRFDVAAPYPTPVVFVHGFLGDHTNFLALRGHLSAAGIRNVASFSYRPRIDYQRLAPRLTSLIEAVCATTGARQVDVVGHSLGGVLARYLSEVSGGRLVRRLVTLGAPYYASRFPDYELAIFGAEDLLVGAPDVSHGPCGRIRVVANCGHLGLLYHPSVFREVAAYLTREGCTAAPVAHSAGRRAA